jgi:hypothetical protein
MVNLSGAPFHLSQDDIRWVEETLQSLSLEH